MYQFNKGLHWKGMENSIELFDSLGNGQSPWQLNSQEAPLEVGFHVAPVFLVCSALVR